MKRMPQLAPTGDLVCCRLCQSWIYFHTGQLYGSEQNQNLLQKTYTFFVRISGWQYNSKCQSYYDIACFLSCFDIPVSFNNLLQWVLSVN